ncbi:E3 ubiquitin-protein ligase rad18 [Linnemannia gamsii]|uniref:RING-type E3 ubiquitin transferase n=1 Tax=Linnemannia gamsii TaxID=64522 RepID=A0ABQ7KCK3_9FUNG|nr:E3 ubiquitin-protein ligase rad18 [Linnemannia gamsii]
MRRNVALDEIANSFGDCRSLLLNTLMEAVRPKPIVKPVPQFVKEESMDIDYDSPQQKRRRTSTRITNRTVSSSQDHADIAMSQVSLDDDKDGDFVLSYQDSSSSRHKGKNTTRSTRPVLRSRGGRAEQSLSQSSQSSQADERYEPNMSTKQEPTSVTTSDPSHRSAITPAQLPSSLGSNTESTSTAATPIVTSATTPATSPNLVACPICEKGIPEPYTNTHLDKFCLAGRTDPDYTLPFNLITKQPPSVIALYAKQGTSTREVVQDTNSSLTRPGTPGRSAGSNSSNSVSPARQPTMQWQPQSTSNGTAPKQPMFTPKPTAPEPKRIPKLTYSLLNDKQLRKKLQELGLLTNGDKTLMAKRHAEYTTIFNANCDSTRPKPVSELKKAMQVWEKAYEQDMGAKEAQRRILEQQQQTQRQILVANEAKRQARTDATYIAAAGMDSPGSTPPSSQSSNGRSSSSTFVPNQTNNNAVNVAIASASAFAHAAKYADEYAELIAEVRSRLKADKDRALAENNSTTTEPAPSSQSMSSQ